MKLIKHTQDQYNFNEYTNPYLIRTCNKYKGNYVIIFNIDNYSKWYLNQ